jgi:hypothetical protein
MRENEFQRRRREREFQDRLLRAVEKPKRSRLLVILNTRLFWGIASLVIATAVGAYFTRSQQCFAESSQLIERFVRINRELKIRNIGIQAETGRAVSVGMIRSSIFTIYGQYADLQDRSLRELHVERLRLGERIDFSGVAELRSRLASPVEPIDIQDYGTYGFVFLAERYREVDELDIEKVKDFARKYFPAVLASANAIELTEFTPRCGVNSLLQSLFDRNSPIVATKPTPSGFMSMLAPSPNLYSGVTVPPLDGPFFKLKVPPNQILFQFPNSR